METSLTFSFFLIFSGAALLASLALISRQPLLIAYIALGAIIGPYGGGWVTDLGLLAEIAEFGIVFLLFLLGLDMQPQALLHSLRKTTGMALISSTIFLAIGYSVGVAFGFTQAEAWIIGAAMMFSSTIIGIKLLPTTVLHHRENGELMVGILLLQDMIAILVLLLISSVSQGELSPISLGKTLVALPLLCALAFVAVRYLLLPLIQRFDHFQEYIFLLAIGWCLGLAEAAHAMGLSAEMGAFLAGISLATSPISQYIAISLKPLRDFFLILFFFSLGARFNLALITEIAAPALLLAAILLTIKPLSFRVLLRRTLASKRLCWDLGLRLGQISEFSLLIAYLAFDQGVIGSSASHLIQATAILSFVVSSYIVVLNCPTPIAIRDELRRD